MASDDFGGILVEDQEQPLPPLSLMPPRNIPRSPEELAASNEEMRRQMGAIPLQLPAYQEPGYETVSPEEESQMEADANAPSVSKWSPSMWQRFRLSQAGQKLLGPTEAEKAGMVSAGEKVGLLQIPERMFEMTLPPPQIRKPAEKAMEQLARTGGPVGGVVAGLGETAMGFASPAFPLVPFASMPRMARLAAATPVTIPAFASLPESKRAYDLAVQEGDYGTAAKIFTQTAANLAVGVAAPLGAIPKAESKIPTERIKDATQARQIEGGVPSERPGIDAQRTAPEAGPSDSLQRTAEGQEAQPKESEVLLNPKEYTPEGEYIFPMSDVKPEDIPLEVPETFPEEYTDSNLLDNYSRSMSEIKHRREFGEKVPEDIQQWHNTVKDEIARRGLKKSKSILREEESFQSSLRQSPSERAMTPERTEPSPEMPPEELAQHQEVAQRLIDNTRNEGINVAIEDSPAPEYSSDVMWTSPDGVVHVNTPRLQEWIKEIGGKNLEEWMQTGLTHESIHSNSLKFLENPAEAMRDYYSNATKAEKLLAERAYYRKFGQKEVDPFQMGAEMFRRDMERLMDLKPTEVVQSKGLEWVKQKFIDLLERGIQKTRQALGTKASKAQQAILDKYQQRIDSVRKAKGWEAPQAMRMEPEEARKRASAIGKMSTEEFRTSMKEIPDGLTGEAYRIGRATNTPDALQELRTLKEQYAQAARDARTAGDFDESMASASRSQFFREAEEAATGTGSAGNWLKKHDLNYVAPMAEQPALRMEPKKSTLEEDPSMGKVASALNRYRMGFRTMFNARANRKIMDQQFDGADTAANNAGQQARNSIEIGTTPIEREAAMAIIESNGDKAKLAQFLAQSKKNPKAAAAVRYANANWDRLQPLAERTQKILDSQIKDENNNGISTEFREAYVPHIYDTDLLMGKGMPYVISGKGTGGSTGFKKGRTFNTVFDAIEAGYTPKSIDVAKLVEHRVKVGQRLINRKQWADGLREVSDPTDKKPLVADIETHKRDNGTTYQTAPMGYERREIIPGVSIAVHSGYSSLFDALTGTSRISGSVPGRIALGAAGGIKHGLLLFDTFHASRIMQKQLFLTGKVSYARGHSLLEYSDADLGRAVDANLITPDIASWIKDHRSDANLLVKEGLNVGRIQEALYADMIKSLQEKASKAAKSIGVPESIANKLQFSKWVFEKVTRGAMLESALIELERISKANPDMPRNQVARKVARDLNTYFGNLGRQGFFKSRTMQDIMNLLFLAPQWMESMARSEVKGSLQLAKGVTLDPILSRTILQGSLGKGMAGGILAYFVGTQLLNMVTRGHPTWENTEDKHKLDAWIPDIQGASKGFFMSPLSVPAELTHDMIRYYQSNPRFLSSAGRILQNKISPLARASQILFIGKDWDKNLVTDDWDRIKRASVSLAPTPLPLSPLVRQASPSGSLQRQLTASAGFKTEPAESGRRTSRPSRPPQQLKRLPRR